MSASNNMPRHRFDTVATYLLCDIRVDFAGVKNCSQRRTKEQSTTLISKEEESMPQPSTGEWGAGFA
jgi:hypothetical protein